MRDNQLLRDDLKEKMLSLNYENKMDSLSIRQFRGETTSLIQTAKNNRQNVSFLDTNNLYLQIETKKTNISKRVEQIEFYKNKIHRMSNDSDDGFTENFVLYILAAMLFFIILMQFISVDSIAIGNTKKKLNKERKEIYCQSCGMILKYDLKPHIEDEFCNTCFDGEKFREPDLSYKDMFVRVENRLKAQNLNKKTIKAYTSRLGKLNRWVRTLRW